MANTANKEEKKTLNINDTHTYGERASKREKKSEHLKMAHNGNG